MSQPDGAFPRVNLAMIKSGNYDNLIISLVCRTVEYNGEGILQVECADGGPMSVTVDEGYQFVPNKIVEIMGHLADGEQPLQVRLICIVARYCCVGHNLFSVNSQCHCFPSISARLQHFVTRDLGDGMALDTYNDMITQVYTNHKYIDLFNSIQ